MSADPKPRAVANPDDDTVATVRCYNETNANDVTVFVRAGGAARWSARTIAVHSDRLRKERATVATSPRAVR